MPRKRPQQLIENLVTATRILVNEGVMDVFGHVAVRDPDEADTFWLARAGAPLAPAHSPETLKGQMGSLADANGPPGARRSAGARGQRPTCDR